MKKFLTFVLSVLTATSIMAAPQVYNDATGDLNDGTVGDNLSGFTMLDISSVTMDSDVANLYITISVANGNITSPDWGNYMIGFDTTAGGDTSLGNNNTNDFQQGNGWDRPIQMTDNGGMDYWVGSWVNGGGGAQVWSYDGANWSEDSNPTPTVGTDLSLTIPLADLGLSAGQTFTFDVYSSGGGGGDSAVDALSSATPSITTWGGPYDTGANGLQYTVVPEPSSLALLGAAGLLALVRRFRK